MELKPYQWWPYEWVTGVIAPISGVITLLLTSRSGPALYKNTIQIPNLLIGILNLKSFVRNWFCCAGRDSEKNLKFDIANKQQKCQWNGVQVTSCLVSNCSKLTIILPCFVDLKALTGSEKNTAGKWRNHHWVIFTCLEVCQQYPNSWEEKPKSPY